MGHNSDHAPSFPADAPPIPPSDSERFGTPDSEEIAALRSIVEGTASNTGQEFLQSLVRHLSDVLNVKYAFVAEFLGDGRARTLAFWAVDRIADDIEWDLHGTPCEDVVKGALCHHPTDVARKFPHDRPLIDWGIESYLGVPLKDRDGRSLGHLAVFDDRPMPPEPRRLAIFRIFAARAGAELERLRVEQKLRESERRYRDLYEEAPIAYIYEDLESRFVRANHAACKLLGISPDEVPDTFGVTLLAPTPDVRKRIQDALAAMKGERKEFAAVELELRRKDDGRPIWVQWWSKPEPDGKHTRTMLVDITERVLMQREKARLEQQNLYLQEEIKQVHNFDEIIGRSPALLNVLNSVERVASTDASVLILGETGTGKELIARAIHSHSARREKPLIKVNCAALPTGLVESELFGHERGAFSGAIARRIGRFELANGGTLFLDEIGELPLDVQAKLLRVLQEGEFERVGGSTLLHVDVRVIAATNRDLRKCVADATFRQDLYYRLNVVPIEVPPLRNRADDVPLLVRFLLNKYQGRVGRQVDDVTPETLRRLVAYPWPGNVRELENVIERAVILSPSSTLEIDPVLLTPPTTSTPDPAGPFDGRGSRVPGRSASESLKEVEKSHILSVLEDTKWVIEGPHGAARILNLHPNTLRSRLKRLGLARSRHERS